MVRKLSKFIFCIAMVLLSPKFSFADYYLQVDGNKLDVESGVSGASIDGTGFGAKIGYLWKDWAIDAGYFSASSELDGQVFSASDEFK